MLLEERPAYVRSFMVPTYLRSHLPPRTASGNSKHDDDNDSCSSISSSEISQEAEEDLVELLEQHLRREIDTLERKLAQQRMGSEMAAVEAPHREDYEGTVIGAGVEGGQTVKEEALVAQHTTNIVVHKHGGVWGAQGVTPPIAPAPSAPTSEVQSQSALLGFIADMSVLRRSKKARGGASCGVYTTMKPYIQRLIQGDQWFEGSVISVVAEGIQQALGDHAKARHISSRLLQAVQRLMMEDLSAQVENDQRQYVLNHAGQIWSCPNKLWLIPAHVPSHWTLVVINPASHSISFFDSLPKRIGADEDEALVRCQVLRVLQMVWENGGGVSPDWAWTSEQRQSRQKNSYDCGAFTLADMAALMHDGVPSQWGQERMVEWREAIVKYLALLKDIIYVPEVAVSAQEGELMSLIGELSML